jgi:predicted MFS family arabinose efflux permease
VPVGLAALAAVRLVPESRGEQSRLDGSGTVLLIAALAAIVLPLVVGREQGWPAWAWISIAAAPVLLLVFLVHQVRRARRGRAPLVRLSLFTDRRFGTGSTVGLLFGLVPPAFFFVLALYLQQGRGYSALFSGVVFIAVGVGYFAAMLCAQQVAARLGRQVLAAGALVVAIGALASAEAAGIGSSVALLPGLALVGAGIGLVLVPLSAEVMRDVPSAEAGAAAGVLATAQQVGGALGIAVIGVVFFGAVTTGVPHAFRVALFAIAGLTLLTAGLAQRLPRR